MRKRIHILIASIFSCFGASAVEAVCPKLQAEFTHRKRQLHHQVIAQRQTAHHNLQQSILYLNQQRPPANICPQERQAINRQLAFQRQQAHRELAANLQTINYQQRMALNQLNSWFASQKQQPYCGSCNACRSHHTITRRTTNPYVTHYGWSWGPSAVASGLRGSTCRTVPYVAPHVGRGLSFSFNVGR